MVKVKPDLLTEFLHQEIKLNVDVLPSGVSHDYSGHKRVMKNTSLMKKFGVFTILDGN